MVAEGQIKSSRTPGDHVRVLRADVDRLLRREAFASAPASSVLANKRERVEELSAGFYGLKIYSPEHSNAEWLDDIGLIWSFEWPRQNPLPPTRTRVAYGTSPTGYTQKEPPVDTAPTLNPDTTYTVVVEPAVGEPEYFTLRGNSLTKADGEFGATVCWGTRNVPGRNPASVSVDCETQKTAHNVRASTGPVEGRTKKADSPTTRAAFSA